MKKYTLPIIITLFSGVIIYQTYTIKTTQNELKRVREELTNLNDTNINLQTDISNIDDSIQSTLNEELGKSHITKDVKFKLNKNVKNGYDLNVRVELKELKENSKVLFMYKEESSNDWQQLEMKIISDLSYSGDFTLPYDSNYEYKVVLKGDITESGDVESIIKSDFMPDSPECSWGYDEEGLYLSAYPDTTDGDNNNKIKKLEVIVSHNKKEKTYTCKYKEEEAYDENNNIVDEFKFYELNIPKKDYSGKLDYIKIKVTYKDGIVDLIDITNKQIDEQGDKSEV